MTSSSRLSHGLTLLLAAATAAAADPSGLPQEATRALDPAVTKAIAQFNAAEDRLRQNPRVEASGPDGDPTMLRAVYRRANPGYKMLDVDQSDGPTVTVRVRAIEVEKRATNMNTTDVKAAFARAPWRDTPRGWVLDFRFRWNGKDWEQAGDPAEFPTLGVAGE